MWKQVTLVTGNENKWQEIQAILGDSITLEREDIDLPELQGSIEEIATAKCREAAERISGPVIVEDTALCFNALGGLPGPYIKSFLTKLGHEGLNRMLMGFGDNGAQAVCTFAFCSGPNQKVTLLQGITEGKIVPPRGPPDFGWDPIFQPTHESGLTYAEMPKDLKNSLSHRRKALDKLKSFILSLSLTPSE